MTRSLAAAAIALLVTACAPPPPEEPAPGRFQIQPLLPSASLDGARARCISARVAEAANAGGLRERARRARIRPDPLGAVPGALPGNALAWSREPGTPTAAALVAVRRIRSDWFAAADYSELADMHARAFEAATDTTRSGLKQRRRAEEVLTRMAWSQPDLEALYQQAFEVRYRGQESCAN